MSDEDEIPWEEKVSGLQATFDRMVTQEAHSAYDDEKNRPMVESLIVMRDEEGELETGWVNIGFEASPDTDRSELAIAVRNAVSGAIRELEEEFPICGVHEGSSGIFYTEPEDDEL